MIDIIVTLEEKGMRLDKFVQAHVSDFSRTHIQKLIKDGAVTVNEKKVTVHNFLKQGAVVNIDAQAPKILEVVPNPAVKFDVVYEDSAYIILNKPTGVVVHQAEGHKESDTLVNGLLAKYPEIAHVGDDPLRPGIVHRLDRDASGIMVIARTPEMFHHLVAQFKKHEVKKEYRVLVRGDIGNSEGIINTPLKRREGKGTMTTHESEEEGKPAITEFVTLKAEPHRSLLQVQTKTGLMHQIRAHLSSIGHSIVGDMLYGHQQGDDNKRLMLHALKLGFTDLGGEWKEFEAPAPKEFSL